MAFENLNHDVEPCVSDGTMESAFQITILRRGDSLCCDLPSTNLVSTTMTRHMRIGLVVLVLALCAFGASAQRTPPTFPPPPAASAPPQQANNIPPAPRPRWEYRIETVRVSASIREQPPNFTYIGWEGWELCGIRDYTLTEAGQTIQVTEFYFKRPVT